MWANSAFFKICKHGGFQVFPRGVCSHNTGGRSLSVEGTVMVQGDCAQIVDLCETTLFISRAEPCESFVMFSFTFLDSFAPMCVVPRLAVHSWISVDGGCWIRSESREIATILVNIGRSQKTVNKVTQQLLALIATFSATRDTLVFIAYCLLRVINLCVSCDQIM